MTEKEFYPLTSPQLSIWYTEKMYPGTSISNVAGTLRIKENIDFDLLERAINLFIESNDGVRLRLCLDDNGNPQQYISEYEYQHLEYVDFSGYEDPVNAMYEWDSNETLKPFELIDCALYRFIMVKLSESNAGFFTNIHHIVSDGWSMSLLGSNIPRYYHQLTCHTIENELLPSYTSFIQNEQNYFSSNRYSKDKLFWDNMFTSSPDATVLKQRISNTKSTISKRKTFITPKKFTNLLKSYCADNKISPYPLFISALAMYINRVTSKEDIIIGTVILNRLNQTEKNTVGMFISTIPLRISMNSESSFKSFYQELLSLLLSSYKHQRYPYESILKLVREKHGTTDNIIDIVLSYQNSKFDRTNDIDYSTRWHFCGHQPNSLTININDRDDEGVLIIDYDYQTDLYYDKEIDFIHQHMLSLLWHALDNPNKEICRIEMLTEREKNKLLNDFNHTVSDYPKDQTIHKLFEEQVKETPDNVALVFEDHYLTYEKLNEKANSLARVLRNNGVSSNSVVAIMTPRSMEMIIGIWAILKAGGAYLFIDYEFPQNRIDLLLTGCKVQVILTEKTCSNKVSMDIVKLDLFDSSLYTHSTKDLLNISNPTDLAYIIYTSGSTGTPKAVMVEHRSLNNFLHATNKFLSINANTTVISFSTASFDIFVFELFSSMINGARLILTNDYERINSQKLYLLFQHYDIDFACATPSVIKLLLDYNSNIFKKTKHLIAGGEQFTIKLLHRLKKSTDAKIYNGYGPSECTIGVTFKDLTEETSINIGKPIMNTQIYILDEYQNLVPIGTPGELHIGGDSLARGYYNQPTLTDEKFISSPFSFNQRLYKTGDLAKWYSKGELQFLGRIDNQIKINGYRIELGEIENVMLQYSPIKEVVTQIKKNDSLGDCICAYYASVQEIDINNLKLFLGKHLPRYMIPRFFTRVDNIPINSNGKIDSARLPEINYPISSRMAAVLPANQIESQLLSKLCDILKIDSFSVEENFFEYGMDSLGVIQFVSYLAKEGILIHTHDVYDNPSVRLLSQKINQIKSVNQKETVKNKNTIKKYIIIESKEISELILNDSLPRVDSAALTYIPDSIISSNDEIIELQKIGSPFIYNYIKTVLGNIAVIALPIFGIEIYSEKTKLLSLCMNAINLAKSVGARTVSLTGLIPSATNYGTDILNNIITSDVKLTTGHATTAASVVLSLERMLLECDRDLYDENICVLGLGSVGTAVTELLFHLYPNINKITICDIEARGNHLNEIKKNLKHHNREVSIVFSKGNRLPDALYQSTLIIGATNVPNLIDIYKLNPGTMIIDDSGPHCFSKEHAINRLSKYGDIIFSEGGILQSKDAITRITYVPPYITSSILNENYQYFIGENEITGCILSSLLTGKYSSLSPTVGRFTYEESLKHYNVLQKGGYKGANLHCDNYAISKDKLNKFKKCFGKPLKSIKHLEGEIFF